jgi:hypothetical protein
MAILRRRRVLVGLLVLAAATCSWLWARSLARARVSTPTLIVDVRHPEGLFAAGAVGLSTETGELARGTLTAAHPTLVRLMRLLGPALLRIGGNSVDTSWWTSAGERAPSWATSTVTPADLSSLAGLLQATKWHVLLGVDLGHFEPARVADEARAAQSILGSHLLGVEIGNEPDDFSHKQFGLRPPGYGLSEYLSEASSYVRAIVAAAPGVSVYGPALTQKTPWLSQIGASGQIFSEITQHFYGTSTCPGSQPAVPPTIEGLLSPAEHQLEQQTLEALGRVGAASQRPTRIGETNNSACLASAGVSPTFASALWALDWALRAVHGGAQGINFHGNLGGVCGANPETPLCAPSAVAAAAGELVAQPEYYGLLAARRLESGRFVPTSLSSPVALPNVLAWATLASNRTLRIAIENLATSGPAQALSIATSGYRASSEQLLAPSVAATNGVSLGAASVSAGAWRPRPVRLKGRRAARVVVPPASAVIVTLHRVHRRR